jgi:hypothetical protein
MIMKMIANARILLTTDGRALPLILIFPSDIFIWLMMNQIRNATTKGLKMLPKYINPTIARVKAARV